MRLIITTFLFSLSGLVCAASEKKIVPSNEPIGVANYLQMFLGLALILGLIFGMAWLMRRMGNMRGIGSNGLKLLGGISLGQRERAVLVQVGDKQLLIGIAPGQIRTLHELETPLNTDKVSETRVNSGFAEKLHAALKQRKQG